MPQVILYKKFNQFKFYPKKDVQNRYQRENICNFNIVTFNSYKKGLRNFYSALSNTRKGIL